MRSSKNLLVAAAALALAGPAMAGGVGPVIVEPAPVAPVITPPAVTDWSGFYGALSYGKVKGDMDDGTTSIDFDSGNAWGLALGYNMQNGNFVYGGEIAYSRPDEVLLEGATGDGLDSIVDVSGRIGYAAGRALIYGKLGYSMTSYSDDLTVDEDYDGVSYGLGVDYLVTDNIFLGVDYTQRNLSGDNDVDLDASTLGLRVGYKF